MIDRLKRNGFVLFLAILAVVVAGALIIATHAAAHLDQSVAAAAINRQRAFAASEHALWSSVANWDASNLALPSGGATTRVVRAAGDSAIVTIVRLNTQLYWVAADATVGGGRMHARRRTGMNVRAVADSEGTQISPVRRSWTELH